MSLTLKTLIPSLKMPILTLKTHVPTLNLIFYLRTPIVKYSFQDLEYLFQWLNVCQIQDLKSLFQGPKIQFKL